jgi:hypothetical protein
MATQYLYSDSTLTAPGTDFQLNGSGATTVAAALDAADSNVVRHRGNTGSDTSSYFTVGNFPWTSANISAVSVYVDQNRTGTVDNAKQRLIVSDHGGSNTYTTYRSVGTETKTVSAPGAGWTVANVNAMRCRIQHDQGANTSTNWITMRFVRFAVTYTQITPASITRSHSNLGTTTVDLSGSYNANGDADTEWRIEYKEDGGTYDSPSWNAETSTGSITTPARSLTNLTSGTLHQYRLAVRNSFDTVTYSAEASFTTVAGSDKVIIFY